jgi:aspartate racemase
MSLPPLHAGLLAHTFEGAALCYLEFCRAAGADRVHPDITLDHIAFEHSALAWEQGDLSAVRSILARSIERLARAGADFFFCPANTAHVALEAPGAPLSLPGLHIVHVVAEEAIRRHCRRVGVLATSSTVESGLYQSALAALGLDALVPASNEQDGLNRLIFADLAHGRFTEQGRQLCRALATSLADRGCDAIALACTELPLILADAPVPLLDSTRLLAQKAFAVAAGEVALPEWRGGPAGIDAHQRSRR